MFKICKECFNKQKKERVKNTNLERYGVINTFQSEEKKQKIKKTNLEKYNVEYPTQSENIRNKIKKVNIERYGCENQFQNNSKELDAATRVLHRARETARNAAKEYDEIRKYAELRRSAVEKSAVVPTSENLEIKFSRSGTARFGSGVN